MQIKNNKYQYGAPAKFLHWLIFLMVASMLAIGLYMAGLEVSPQKIRLYGLHKSFGVMVLVLVLLRLMWKLANTNPILPDTLNDLQKLAARAAHWLLYALLIAMPITGWLMSSYAGFPVSVFGLFTLPDLVQVNDEMRKLFADIHEYLAYALMALIALHALAALLHHFYFKDNVLRSMLPFVKMDE